MDICIEPFDNLEFKGGTNAFRRMLYNKFKADKNSKSGENLIRITIGRKNNLELVEIVKYSDEKIRKQIEGIFSLKDFSYWSSARLYRIPVKKQFEISIFIDAKK